MEDGQGQQIRSVPQSVAAARERSTDVESGSGAVSARPLASQSTVTSSGGAPVGYRTWICWGVSSQGDPAAALPSALHGENDAL